MQSPRPLRLILLLCTSAITSTLLAGPAVFVNQGQLLIIAPGTSSTVAVHPAATAAAPAPLPVSNYWGTLASGQLLVTLKSDVPHDAISGEDHHCSTHSPGECGFLLRPDGTVQDKVTTDILRAYPAPLGNKVAIVTSARDLVLWHDGSATTVTAPGKVSNAGWAPNGRHLVAAVRPADWSEGGVSAAPTTAEFLRLQNSDLHLFDTSTMQWVAQLTHDSGTEYGAFFSPDGTSLYYHWAHLLEDQGGLMRLDLDRDDGTSASAPAVKLTTAGNDPGETPLGRVGTYSWLKGGTQLVFEAGLSDGFGEVWTTSASGTGSARLATGRHPQLLDPDNIIFVDRQGVPATITPGGAR